MGKNDDRVQWAQVPGVPEVWASESGQVATHAPGGGFDVLDQQPNADGNLYVYFPRGGGESKGKRFVARLVLAAFVERRESAHAVTHADGDPGNCRLANLSWWRRGEPVGNLTRRRCLGANCGVDFMSTGPGNRLCPICGKRAKESSNTGLDAYGDGGVGGGELPDDMLVGGGTYK